MGEKLPPQQRAALTRRGQGGQGAPKRRQGPQRRESARGPGSRAAPRPRPVPQLGPLVPAQGPVAAAARAEVEAGPRRARQQHEQQQQRRRRRPGRRHGSRARAARPRLVPTPPGPDPAPRPARPLRWLRPGGPSPGAGRAPAPGDPAPPRPPAGPAARTRVTRPGPRRTPDRTPPAGAGLRSPAGPISPRAARLGSWRPLAQESCPLPSSPPPTPGDRGSPSPGRRPRLAFCLPFPEGPGPFWRDVYTEGKGDPFRKCMPQRAPSLGDAP